MIDLYKAEQFMRSLTVRDRATNRPVPFRLNPSQARMMEDCKKHVASGHRLFVISLKGRRLGVSTMVRNMMQAHLIEKSYSEGLILGQQATTAKALYEEAHKVAKQLPIKPSGWKYTQKEINFWNVPSKLSWQTAGNVKGTRGLGFTFLHGTEAAYYDNPDIFPAVFSTLSDDPENMGFIESTPNGMEGPGEAYWKLWEASVAGDTEYLASFLAWHEDPGYVRDPAKAKDAPRDEYERFLMKDLKLGKDRVAFFREVLQSKCGGKLDRWRREYPGTAEEAFETSGDPVFNFDQTTAAEKWSEGTKFEQIELDVNESQHQARAREKKDGRFVVFERPEASSHYFAGVMIGHGERAEGSPPEDDTLAMVVWNGETGVLAGRFHILLREEHATEAVYAFGCYFNRAMIACEDGNGGFGTRIFQELRDRRRYPNQYRWKSRNDKIDPLQSTQSLGFTITDNTRKQILHALKTSMLRRECIPNDPAFTEQMHSIQWENPWRFEAQAFVDEIFFAGALGWIARDQWHPNRCAGYKGSQPNDTFEDFLKQIPHQKTYYGAVDGIAVMNLQHHLDQVKQREQSYAQETKALAQ